MTLLEAFDALLAETERTFSQQRVLARARQLAYGFVTSWGRHTISRALCATGAQFRGWSASYRVFFRSPWDPHDLFQPVLAGTRTSRGSPRKLRPRASQARLYWPSSLSQ